MFTLDKRLAKDCVEVSHLPLCKLLLMKDANYPWLILVPAIENISEIIELSRREQLQLALESAWVSRCLQHCFEPDKLNVAALGNVVSQLHVHHIARFKTDPAWPGPVWGHGPAETYSETDLVNRIKLIKHGMEATYDHDDYK